MSKTTYYAYKPNSGKWATTHTKTFDHGSGYAINSFPSVITEAKDNGYAAVIRSIGWTNGSGNSYPGITGNVCKERSAGKLFLGTYAFDVDSKTDTYNYGIEFTSRPNKISFDYKYTSYHNDTYKVWTAVSNRNNNSLLRFD